MANPNDGLLASLSDDSSSSTNSTLTTSIDNDNTTTNNTTTTSNSTTSSTTTKKNSPSTSTTAGGSISGMELSIPWYVMRGEYKARIQLKDPQDRPITCAQTSFTVV